MNSEHRYAGSEDNKMHELYYKRETGLGLDNIQVQAQNRSSGNPRSHVDVTVVGTMTWN